MACEVNNKEINSQCAELLVRLTYIMHTIFVCISSTFINIGPVYFQ